jgi:hypothetical protein
MSTVSTDDGVLFALLERFEKFRLPRVLEIKERVDRGEKLSEADIDFLEVVLEDADEARPYVDKHPELQSLYARTVGLYGEITEQALANEQGS